MKEKSEDSTRCEIEFQNESWNNKEIKRAAPRQDSYFHEMFHDSEIRDKADAYGICLNSF